MDVRARLIQALKFDYKKLQALDFFLILAEKLNERTNIGFRLDISVRNLIEILSEFPKTGISKQYFYHLTEKKWISMKDLVSVAEDIQNFANPEAIDTKNIYEFPCEFQFHVILAELISNYYDHGDSKCRKTYVFRKPDSTCFTATIDGMFYYALQPGAIPLASVGDEIEEGSDIGVIIVSKVTNYIAAPFSAKIIKVLIPDNSSVLSGQPLFIVEPIILE
jgi:biotin carboxyl carrier protein